MAFQFKLEDDDGQPTDPPTLRSAVPNWQDLPLCLIGSKRREDAWRFPRRSQFQASSHAGSRRT
jgi:hypothetical protein